MHCKLILSSLLLLLAFSPAARADKLPDDLNSAAVYAYFRVGDDDHDTPGINLQDFQTQIEEISKAENGYHPSSLDTILKAQSNNTSLPAKTIAMTFEGSETSFLRNALPVLEQNDIPFALFISPGLIDQAEKSNDPSIMTWDNIRKIAKSDLATIGLTSYSYTHVDGKTADTLIADLNHARERFRDELKKEPAYFSYPFGEYTPAFLDAISKQGFSAAFGQQSGVIGKKSPRNTLPRFTMTDDFADIERFRMTSASLPFPVTELEPPTTLIDTNPPHPGFTVSDEISETDLKKIKCFATGMDKVDVKKISTRHFEIRFDTPFEDSKGRLNCTLPAPALEGSDEPRWRWLGFQFTIPE